MNRSELNERLTRWLHRLSPWDFKLVLGIATVVTTASVLQLVYSVGHLNGQEALEISLRSNNLPGIYTNFDFAYWLVATHVAITVGLVIATIGLWSKKLIGFLLSMVALLWVCIVYVWWYRETLHFLKNIEVTEYTRLHNPYFRDMGILRGASRWDLLVLIATVLLLLWHLRMLLGIRSSKPDVTPEV